MRERAAVRSDRPRRSYWLPAIRFLLVFAAHRSRWAAAIRFLPDGDILLLTFSTLCSKRGTGSRSLASVVRTPSCSFCHNSSNVSLFISFLTVHDDVIFTVLEHC